jgi:ABC-2 type transport system permease protein
VLGGIFAGSGPGDRPPAAALTLAVHLEAGDGRAARALAVLAASGAFAVQQEPTAARVRARVADGSAAAGLVFPAGFDPQGRHPGELVLDPSAPPEARGPLEAALAGLVARSLLVDPALRVLVTTAPAGPAATPPPTATSFQLFVPGSAVLFGFFIALTVAISFVHERRSGTFRRLLAAPVRRPIVLLAKLVPYYLVGLVQMVFLFGLGAAAFGMQIAGSLAALALLVAVVVFASVALGLLIASFGGTERLVGAIGSVCLLVMGLLGGSMVPRVVMPPLMRTVGLFTPHAWALDGYHDLLVRAGTGLPDVWRQVAAVAAFGLAFAVIGAARFRFER